jgi:outer membrane protein TolC
MTETALTVETDLELREQIEMLAESIHVAQHSVSLAERRVEVAEENYRLVTRLHETGSASSLEMLAAKEGLAIAKASLVIERLSYDIAILTLAEVVGGPDDPEPT